MSQQLFEAQKTFPELAVVPEQPKSNKSLVLDKLRRQIQPQDMTVLNEEKKATASFNLEIPLALMIDSSVRDYVENKSGIGEYLEMMIEREAAKRKPVVISINAKEPVKMNGRLHKSFEKCLRLITIKKQLFISGPAGTGKTTLGSQIANAIGLKFESISCSAGMSEAHLTGRMVADGSYIMSSFVDCYENGGLFLFDEIDAADSNTMLIINSALANGHMSITNRKEKSTAIRHKDFYCMCAANTWGNGSSEYAGRNVLDAAFLDRFAMSKVTVEYDEELEKEICAKQLDLYNTIRAVRLNVVATKLRRVVSTRAFIDGCALACNGFSIKEIMDIFFEGWSEAEIAKAKTGTGLK